MNDEIDALVVGGGLSGAVVTARLAAAGINVVCLEQGDWPDYSRSRAEFDDYEVTAEYYWGRDTNKRRALGDYPIDHSESDIMPIMWNGVGGGTVLYGARWNRLAPSDFQVRSLDGVASDWPISYEDLAPYYSEAERQFGVSGLANDTAYPAGYNPPNPPVPLREFGRRTARAHNKLGWHWWPGSNAISTTHYRNLLSPCRQHGVCTRGCPEGAKASTDLTHWPQAIRDGAKLETGARVVSLVTGGDKVTSVVYRVNGVNHQISARVVVLAGNGIGTPRLLLASADAVHPDGLGNHSGLVGRNLMMHPYAVVAGVFEDELGSVHGAAGQTIYSMQFYETDTDRGFVRGAKWGMGGTGGPLDLSTGYPWVQYGQPIWFDSFHQTVRERLGRTATWTIVGEDLPELGNRVDLHPVLKDSDGLPAPRVTYRLSENSRRLLDFHTARATESLEVAGAVQVAADPFVPESGWHLMGTARMGTDPEASVTDPWGRVHEVSNLWIADSSTWVTSGGVNPSATQAALALRTADRLLSTEGGLR